MTDEETVSKDVNIVEKSSLDDERLPTETSPTPPTKMTPRRFMALLSLVWLITTSATPILFIAGTLCNTAYLLFVVVF